MGAFSIPILDALNFGEEEVSDKPLPLKTKYKDGFCIVKRSRMTLRKRKNLREGSRRPINVVEKRVRTLRKLVPSTEPVGLDGLFRDTADYIVALQLRVKLMQDLVVLLSGSDE